MDGIQVLITSGSMDDSLSPSFLEYWDIEPTGGATGSRSRVLHADGTATYTASINFDVTEKALPLFGTTRLLERYKEFDVGIHDGENHHTLKKCRVTSLSLSAAPGGLIAASLSVIARLTNDGAAVANNYILNYDSDPTNQPQGYWWSGATDVRDWTFTYNQDVAPVFLNEDTTDARYSRVGLIAYSLTTTTYSEISHNTINVMTDSFSITGVATGNGYTYNGPTDLGMYSHTFESAADATVGSDDIVIT